MARLVILALLALAGAAHAADDPAFAAIRERLEKHAVVHADYVQMRTLADLKRPLMSRGRLIAWNAGGVIWHIDQPFKATYVLRDESTIEIAADGTRTVRSASDDRGAARIGRVLRAVLKGDARSIEELFEASARIEGERWSLTLTPRKGPVAYFVKTVQLHGGDFVDGVRIVEENGDATHMQFRNQRSAGAPSDEERRLLAGE
jgi:hypothetical protein